jgi:methionyl-tRNA formyltransferase
MTKNSNNPRILFVGEGHGAHAAYLSLKKQFDLVYVLGGIDPALEALTTSDYVSAIMTHEGFDLIVTAGYRHKYPSELIKKIPIINIHYALLPRFRGLHSLVWAMLNHEPKIGLTIHIVNEAFDAGPILYQYAVAHEKQTSWEFMALFDQHVHDYLGQVVQDYWTGNIQPKPQNDEEALWCCRRNQEDCRIDFHATCKDLEVFIRALVKPYPLPYLLIKETPYQLIASELKTRPYNIPVGRVVNVDAQGAWIKIQDGFLIVKRLESPQGEIIAAEQLLKLGMRLI